LKGAADRLAANPTFLQMNRLQQENAWRKECKQILDHYIQRQKVQGVDLSGLQPITIAPAQQLKWTKIAALTLTQAPLMKPGDEEVEGLTPELCKKLKKNARWLNDNMLIHDESNILDARLVARKELAWEIVKARAIDKEGYPENPGRVTLGVSNKMKELALALPSGDLMMLEKGSDVIFGPELRQALCKAATDLRAMPSDVDWTQDWVETVNQLMDKHWADHGF
jgi:hypothetical protein